MKARKWLAAAGMIFTAMCGLHAMELEASARIRPSLFSRYHEQAGSGFSGDPQEIWGDFDTYFADADLGIPCILGVRRTT
jgi:hypothetical protein